jgi:hypothetical protein
VEIRAVSPLLPSGTHLMERTVLSAAAMDNISFANWRVALPLPRLPLQFCQLQAV